MTKIGGWFAGIFLVLVLASCEDTVPPVLRIKGADTIEHILHTPFQDPDFVGFDNEDLDISDQVVRLGTVDIHKVGYYPVTYRLTDEAGNSAETHVVVHNRIGVDSYYGIYRSYNNFGSCAGTGRCIVSPGADSGEWYQYIDFRPAVGEVTAAYNYLYMYVLFSDLQTLNTGNGQLPCNHFVNQTLQTYVSPNVDTIQISGNFTALLGGSPQYISISYYREF